MCRNTPSSKIALRSASRVTQKEENESLDFMQRPSNSDQSPRRVCFASPLVEETHFRPRTLPKDVSGLFYSFEETAAFREEFVDMQRAAYRRREQCKNDLSQERKVVEGSSKRGGLMNKVASLMAVGPLSLTFSQPSVTTVEQTTSHNATESNEASNMSYFWDLGMVFTAL